MTSLIYAAKLPKNLQTPWRNGVGGGVEAAQLTSVCVTPGGKLMWISGPIATQTESYGQLFKALPISLNPMTSVLLRGTQKKDTGRRGGEVSSEAETRVMWPQAKECWGHPRRDEAGKEAPLKPPEGAQPSRHLDFKLLASRICLKTLKLLPTPKSWESLHKEPTFRFS